jgi:hypothetical protein
MRGEDQLLWGLVEDLGMWRARRLMLGLLLRTQSLKKLGLAWLDGRVNRMSGMYVLLVEVAVIWAKEEEGRIIERKSRDEENWNVLAHAQDGLDRCLERIFDMQQDKICCRSRRSGNARRLGWDEHVYFGRVSRRHHHFLESMMNLTLTFDSVWLEQWMDFGGEKMIGAITMQG